VGDRSRAMHIRSRVADLLPKESAILMVAQLRCYNLGNLVAEVW